MSDSRPDLSHADPLSIAVLCHTGAGGSGVVATELGLLMASLGHAVHFVGGQVPFRLSRRCAVHGPYFHQIGSFAYALFEQPYPELSAANTLSEVILEQGVQLTHAHYAIPHATAALHAYAITGRAPVMTTLHGTDVTLVGAEPAFYHTTRHAIMQSHHVTAVSQFLAEQTREVFDTDREIEVIYNFVDPERFRPVDNPQLRARFAREDEALLVHVSNFRPVKRVLDVIQTFAGVLSERPARLLMIGDGPDRAPALELAQRLGVADRVNFLGSFPDVETVLGLSDLFLLPSSKESFGLSALEAMSCQVPVVAARAGGIPEVVVDGVTGRLADVGDVDGLTQAALDVLDRRAEMGRAARERAIAHFHPGIVAPQYLAAYQRTLEQWQN